jgi:hypothetical protein
MEPVKMANHELGPIPDVKIHCCSGALNEFAAAHRTGSSRIGCRVAPI